MNTLDLTWETEREDLAALYQDDRAERLAWAIEYARQCRGQPLLVKQHLTDWLTLLTHVHDRLDLHEAALELISLLYQPVIHLGHFAEWTSQVRFAIAVCDRLGRTAEQAEFLERLVEGTLGLAYWSSGRLLKAEWHMRRSAQAAKQLNARWQFARQTGNLALVALFRGRLLIFIG
ncbi:MAG: hypothetical protein ACYDBJ_10795 [Aggregatilineales bacterium]